MSSVFTLRACLVAGGAALLLALTGCSDIATQTDPMAGATRLELPALGTVHYAQAQPQPRGTNVGPTLGTDAGLVTTPAPGTVEPQRPTASHQAATTSTPAAEPAPVQLSLAPLVQEQLPEEAAGGDRDPGPVPPPVAQPGPVDCAGQYVGAGTWCDTPDPVDVQEQLPGETTGGDRDDVTSTEG